ncbi:PREDICTED: vasoactive intestinal polypeptide receptor-like [Poecilia mexicana]|uniref:vasoactive intestinal polypeptide receptor-like n=1 Tax=Poecilia mexicana TaxID=48701 RepID=UPI00072E40F3|nr:PREDICTED: vasoactive intestinal polypeptide receptor-like [Poecilia mexicana]XP_016527256.1 PREDICTED: vasoactive intestinal polypeptide receptor 1 [Poecilia formosa]
MLVRFSRSICLFLSCALLDPVRSAQSSKCDLILEIDKERAMCQAQVENNTTGCNITWDKIACWPSADVGEVVTIPCPKYLFYFTSNALPRNLSKTCTVQGWPPSSLDSYILGCGYNPNNTAEENSGDFYITIKVGYTIGHSVSLISLMVAISILCFFRKLHCTRNYIHMHLFVSLILKAITVFIKDVVLYEVGETENCQAPVGCKAVVVLFQYGVMASYFWLLVEGLYLHALLAVSFFSERKYFWWYILIGWGAPTIFISAWVVTKVYLNPPGCWETIDDASWWIIKTPILVAILMNFFLFICIIRILQQKMNCPDIGRKESNQYSRLTKSTLLLIPLFGINYIIFAFIPEHIHPQLRMVFDLVLGSFQGFVVAVLYCFLNGEVQSEVKRKWRRWMLQRFLGADTKYQQPSIGSNGNNFSTQITLLTKCSPITRRASACQEHLSAI